MATLNQVPLLRRWGAELLLIPAIFAGIIFIWAGFIAAFNVRPVILPDPQMVWAALARGLMVELSDPAGYYVHTLQTLGEALGGYTLGSLLGLVLGLLLSQVPLLERVFKPFIVAFQSVPKIAIAPLLIVWFGFGATSKVVLVTLIVFFPVLVAALTGFKSVDRERMNVMRSLGATRWQIFTKLVLPGSMPFVFTGLEIALVHAMTATIVAEFLAGRAGLGVLVVQFEQVLDTAGIFSVLAILGFLGWALSLVLATIRRRLVFWSTAERGLLV